MTCDICGDEIRECGVGRYMDLSCGGWHHISFDIYDHRPKPYKPRNDEDLPLEMIDE